MAILETVNWYRQVLESLGYTIRGNRVYIVGSDGEQEALIDNKQLVLPDDTFLRNPKWDTEVPFHPLCENPQRGESEVVKSVLQTVVGNLNVSLLGLMLRLYVDVASIPDTKKLTTEQSALLPFVPTIDEKVKKALLGMIETVTMENDNSSLITCNLRRRCPLGDTRYERVCVVRFPFADMNRKDKPYGLSTTAAFDTLRGLLDFVLPGWENDDTYSVGTNSFVAPYFTSVMMMYSRVAMRLNEVIDLFADVCPNLDCYRAIGIEAVTEAITTAGRMESLRDAIPALDGNKGNLDVSTAPPAGYKIEQPKPAVDIPWETQPNENMVATSAAVTPKVDASEGKPYVPGSVVPQPVIQQTMPLMAPLGGMGVQYDPNSFHGRQMAKVALMNPLSQQLVHHGAVGGSPFLEDASKPNGDQGATYRPGVLTQQQRTQVPQQNQMIGNNGLGF